jgi:hypothetical protein
MIENQDQLQAAIQAIGRLYLGLASLRERVLPVNPRQYELFAEGPIDEISKIQSEIDAYLGLPQVQAEHVLRETPPGYGTASEDHRP